MATTIQEWEAELAATSSQATKDAIQAEIQRLKQLEKAAGGDQVSALLVALKDALQVVRKNTAGPGGTGVSKTDVEEMLKNVLKKHKIGLDDLSDELRSNLTSGMRVSLTLTSDKFIGPGGSTNKDTYEQPLFQKVLSDAVAMNNIYLFGGAGTGKTFIAEQLADFLGYEFILLPCNQFTSPLEILGGQTIDGYQTGKLERAWGNLDAEGNPSKYPGAVLCLDELPKIDPNTAGLLNDALAKVKNYKGDGANRIPPVIENGRGVSIPKGNLVIIATGNLKLNELSTEYEANFKQDLSLQDRFSGSTYEVTVNYETEFYKVMKGFAFIWIALTKLREKIVAEKLTGFAFVSLRIMMNLKASYIVYREAIAKKLPATVGQNIKDTLQAPKTLKQGLDSFLNLFKPDQIDRLKQAMGYDNFIRIIEEKNKLDLDKLDTPAEISEAQRMIAANKAELAKKIA